MRAIESVRQQTYTNWEIVLVDDSSTDNSHELYVDLEKDERIHVYHNEQNMGCGYTKRKCIEMAHGDFCGFLDPDDELYSSAINSMVAVHNANKDVSVVYSRCKECDIKTNEIVGENSLLVLQENETFFDYRNYGAMHFTTFKKAFYDKTEGIASEIKAGVDQDLNFKIEEVGKIYVLNEYTYKYYVNNDNSISASNKLPELFFWNIYVRYQTCLRRNLPTREIMHQDIVKYMEQCIKAGKYNAELEMHRSIRYRIGDRLISPIKFMLSTFKKIN